MRIFAKIVLDSYLCSSRDCVVRPLNPGISLILSITMMQEVVDVLNGGYLHDLFFYGRGEVAGRIFQKIGLSQSCNVNRLRFSS